MFQVDPLKKAAECERAIQGAMDPQHRAVLAHLRNLWIALGNEREFMSVDELANEAAAIDRLHSELVRSKQPTLH